jgi:hypothetical protein
MYRLYYQIGGVFQLVDQAEKIEDLPTPNGPVGMEWKITGGEAEEKEREGTKIREKITELKTECDSKLVWANTIDQARQVTSYYFNQILELFGERKE